MVRHSRPARLVHAWFDAWMYRSKWPIGRLSDWVSALPLPSRSDAVLCRWVSCSLLWKWHARRQHCANSKAHESIKIGSTRGRSELISFKTELRDSCELSCFGFSWTLKQQRPPIFGNVYSSHGKRSIDSLPESVVLPPCCPDPGCTVTGGIGTRLAAFKR